jgi:hypothetical protein
MRPREADSLKDPFTKVESFMDAFNEQKVERKRQPK